MQAVSELRRTPLYECHLRYGGKMIDFAGWALPVQFTSIKDEHHAVRKAAGLFDVSDMGEVEISGPQALDLVQRAVTNDASRMRVGRVMYSPMCNPRGGLIDDLLVYRLGDDRFMLVVNAANIGKDYSWLRELSGQFPRATVTNLSDEVAQLALQGPNSEPILAKLTDADLSSLKYYWCQDGVEVAGVRCLVSRTGYTGEDGFELYCAPQEAPRLWEAILEAGREYGAVPAGLGCRDTLRFEAGMVLYGNELTEETTPLEAGLGRYVKFNKGDFVGRQALLKQKEEGVRRRLVGFRMIDRGIPRHGYPIVVGGAEVGVVTSGTYAPTLDANLGLGYVPVELSAPGTEICVLVRGRQLKAQVVEIPFYRREEGKR